MLILITLLYLSYVKYASSNLKNDENRIFPVTWAVFLLLYCAAIPPLFSIDLYEYVIRGRMQALYGLNPFWITPEAVPEDPLYPVIFWKTVTTVYGPLWSALSAAIVKLSSPNAFYNIAGFKLVSFILHLSSGAMIFLLARKTDPERTKYITFLYLFSPYLIFMNLIENHNDVLMVFLMLAAFYLLTEKRYALSVTAIILSASAKFISIILLPLFLIHIHKSGLRLKDKIYLALKISAVNAVILYALFVPYGLNLGNISSSIHATQLRLDTNTFTYITYNLLSLFNPAIDIQRFCSFSNITFALFCLGIYLFYLLRARVEKIDTLITVSLAVFIAYFLTASFQFGNWYLSWIAPLILLSRFPKKNLFFILITFAALVAFWKRVSFLLIGSTAIYCVILCLPEKLKLPAFLREIMD
ncbi:MAG: hypothetical protein ABIA77_02115 [Candidatus Omnitrophota bacterium]